MQCSSVRMWISVNIYYADIQGGDIKCRRQRERERKERYKIDKVFMLRNTLPCTLFFFSIKLHDLISYWFSDEKHWDKYTAIAVFSSLSSSSVDIVVTAIALALAVFVFFPQFNDGEQHYRSRGKKSNISFPQSKRKENTIESVSLLVACVCVCVCVSRSLRFIVSLLFVLDNFYNLMKRGT